MNQSDQNKSIEKLLEETAESVNPSPNFVANLEDKLVKAHKPKKGLAFSSSLSIGPAMGWSLAIIALALAMSWVRSFTTQVTGTGDNFICPVTLPNGSLPPGETVTSPNYLGNGELWTGLWPDGKIYMLPDNQRSDGSFDMKWPWWRGVSGPLTIEGHRLDADAEPLSADIPDGYGDIGFQVSGLYFPTTGCWEVTGRVGDSSLTFVTEVIFGEATPTPDAVIDTNTTPVTTNNTAGYNFRGGKLILSQPLPDSPSQANVYLLDQNKLQVTLNDVRALAQRFGIQGEVYSTIGRMQGTSTYMVSDGKAQLVAYSLNSFTYTSDLVKSGRTFIGAENDNAETIIRDFLQAHGFDFPIRVSKSNLYGGYQVEELSPDGYPMQYEYFSPSVMSVMLSENGQVLSVNAELMKFDPAPLGSFGIISSDDALQILLDDRISTGKIESSHAGLGAQPQQWYRDYPDDQTVTIYGYVTVNAAIDPGKPALILVDSVPVTGNISGMESLEYNSFVEATGQYAIENGIRKFNVTSWNDQAKEFSASGYLDQYPSQTILITGSDDGNRVTHPIDELPADVPLNTDPAKTYLSISGALVDGKVFWTSIQYFADASQMGGGGGGGGLGFYKLNLNGKPIPFPTDTPAPTVVVAPNSQQYVVQEGDTLMKISGAHNLSINEIMQANGMFSPNIDIGQTLIIPPPVEPVYLDGLRGMLSVSIYSKEDGTQRTEFMLNTNDPISPYMVLEGTKLDELKQYTNKPIRISGVTEHMNPYGFMLVNVEKYEIPFPDLQPEILKGTEKTAELDNKSIVLFTTEDGRVFVEYAPNCFDMMGEESMSGVKGGGNGNNSVLLEALAVPDLSFGSYPGICIFSSTAALLPSGDPAQLSIDSNRLNIMPELPDTINGAAPNLTIDKVELVYFVSNPQFQANDPSAANRDAHIQPVWHFHGFYDDGTEFDIVVQALKKEFLSPEFASFIQGG